MLPLAAVAAALLGTACAYDTSLPTVDLGYQVYRASSFNASGNFYSFSNIRYAAPPVGELRFALPQPPVRNRSAINNGDLSRMCPQGVPGWFAITEPAMISQSLEPLFTNTTYVAPGANASSPMPPPNPRESEDCLFLDVAVPKHIFERAAKPSKQAGAPVLVWIHGGGFTIGEKTNNPAGLLAASGSKTQGDIIYVSFNYRLGAFGYLSGPSFQAEGGVSNLGFYDQRMALEWVQNNIHLFGGDKNQVTIFGESAGGGSVIHQLTAYGGSKGPVPFQRAIPQSGGWIPYSSSVLQEDKYRKFLSLTNATSLAQLRALPSEALIRANAQQVRYDSTYGTFTFGAAVDGIFAPLQPNQLITQGRFDKNVRVMIGYNSLEGGPFVPFTIKSEADIRKYVKSIYEATPDSSINHILDNLYPPIFDGSLGYTNNLERALLLVSEGPLTCHTWSLGQAYGNKTYAYLFSVPPALHGLDLGYTYHDGGTSPLVKNATVAFALQQLITSFAKTGVPKATGIDQFDMYGPDENVLELNITGFRQIHDPNVAARCAWWAKALF